MRKLENKICVVTGGGRGIGRAIAESFHAEGVTVVVADIDADMGSNTAAQIGYRFEPLDVRDEKGCRLKPITTNSSL
ncbi:SDR family NAD(P)-dependent oxidoreductase [Acetobacter orientalis]|uniref:SDR family NAD(P)-dependent oxidoreductase n=1 Tax=Acetobacter orientalis TaxID=146474 RepID=UPI0039EB0AB0